MSQNIELGGVAGNNAAANIPLGDSNQARAGVSGGDGQVSGASQQQALIGDQANDANKAAEEQKNKEQAKQNDRSKHHSMQDWEPQLERSYLLPNNDRYILEQVHMQHLKAGSGLFGTRLVQLDELKRAHVNIPPEKKLQRNKEMLENMRLDGIYVDDPEVHGKFTDINVQKLEERLLKNGQSEFFKMNGELKLDNDILDDDLTRPADLAFEQTTAYQTTEINAILSDRLHSFKKRLFRLDIILGNVKLFNCKDHFSLEDRLAIKLKEHFQDYETRISLCMIPFYMDRLIYIQSELDNAIRKPITRKTEEEISFLSKTKEEAQRSLDKEKHEVNQMANQMYDIWKNISQERTKKKFLSTNVELKVHNSTVNGEQDQMLDLKYDNSITPEKDLPSSEKSRQAGIKALKMYAVLVINGRKVSQTNKIDISWPNFNFQIKEYFQVHVYTIPSSIKIELVLCDGWRPDLVVDVVKVDVPGQHVKSLTCSCPLIQKIPFSKIAFEKSKVARKFEQQSYKPDGELSEKQRLQMKQAQEKKQKKEQLQKETDIEGEIFIRAEWRDSGPKMPPTRSENLFKKAAVLKNRKKYTQGEELMMLLKQLYIDVNDPRNQVIIKLLKESKNEFLVNLLNLDSKNLQQEAKPFRHKLLTARSKDVANFGKVFIPMLESELIDSARSSFYLSQLEQLFRQEAYLIHLQNMVTKQNESQEPAFKQEFDNMVSMMDLETLRRRQLIFDQIKQRKQQQQQESNKGGSTYRSIVEEEEFIYDTSIFLSFFKRFNASRRKLKPAIKERPPKNLELVQDCRIVIHVVKAENVPIRYDLIKQYQNFIDGAGGEKSRRKGPHRPTANRPDRAGDPDYEDQDEFEDDRQNRAFKSKDQLDNTPQVETFVEIKIQYYDKYSIIKTTYTDEGTMPRWNEILDFPLESKNKEFFTQEELASTNALIIASLFDKQTYETVREGNTVLQEENRFLGSVTIPLQTLLSNDGKKTDFNFRLARPICLPNYRVLDEEIYFMKSTELEKNRKMENEQPPTYLNLSITLEPHIELPSQNDQLSYPGYELQKDLYEGVDWAQKCLSKAKSRKHRNANIKVFGENTKGQSVLLCRYLTPQKPPKQIVDLVQQRADPYAIEKAARFVAMIPYIEDLRLFQDMPDLYSTSQEFFDLGGGDYEEHAILLANYFSYIDQEQGRESKVFLVLGCGLPNGQMNYVMRKISLAEKSFELWDPLTATCYFFQSEPIGGLFNKSASRLETRLLDPVCPLQQIHTIVSSENIYVNNMKDDIPILMEFDFTNKKKWSRLYAKEEPKETYQTIVDYPDPIENAQKLEARIQKYLIEMFQDERIKKVKRTTKWAVTLNDELQAILIDCEDWSKLARHGGINSNMLAKDRQSVDEGIQIGSITIKLDKLAQQDSNKRVWGFPLNCTFTSLENLWKLVQNTKMHQVNRQDIEFGLAVYIAPQPANILSVWIYLAAFVDTTIENLYN